MENKINIKINEYKEFFTLIKTEIQNAQIKASIAVNIELLKLYWNIAEMIIEKQEKSSSLTTGLKELALCAKSNSNPLSALSNVKLAIDRT